jgi:hypothetical protein
MKVVLWKAKTTLKQLFFYVLLLVSIHVDYGFQIVSKHFALSDIFPWPFPSESQQ